MPSLPRKFGVAANSEITKAIDARLAETEDFLKNYHKVLMAVKVSLGKHTPKSAEIVKTIKSLSGLLDLSLQPK